MSKSTHQIAVTGVDKTAKAFASIQARAIATGNRIASVMGGAIAAAGTYLSFRTIKSGIVELGNLSDLAMKAGTSVDALTKASLAFQVAGLNLPVETLAKSFQNLKKQTGEGGMENFFKVASEISKIEDPAKRGAELVKNFGQAGLELQPLIDGGEEAIRKMKLLSELMPGVSQAAAGAGNETAKAMTILGTGLHNIWLKVVGNIVGMWNDDFPGGVRAGALNAINWFEWALKRMFNSSVRWGATIGLKLQAMWNWAKNGYTWEQAMEEYDRLAAMLDKELDAKQKELDSKREAYKSKLKELSKEDLDKLFGEGNKGKNGNNIQEEERAKQPPRINNQLIAGGSNAERRLSILGPDYQNEAKKQTEELRKQNEILDKIAENTKKTADEAETTYTQTDLGA